MPIRAYLVLHRTRLIWCAAVALLVPFAIVLFTASGDVLDFGVFWNHFCGCAPDKSDTFALLYTSTFTASLVGIILATGNASTVTAVRQSTPNSLFYLTRPMQRCTALLSPVMIAGFVIAVFPATGFAIAFGWLRLVHAPALAFFARALRLVPDAAGLPQGSSLVSLLLAVHAPACYAASVSVGLLFHMLYYSQRWLLLSRHVWVRIVAAVMTIPIFLFPALMRNKSFHAAALIMLLPSDHRLEWHPSAAMLLVHYAVSAGLLWWSWRTLQAAEF